MIDYPINDKGVKLLKRSEGLVLHAYPDPRSPLGVALQQANLWRQYLKKPIPRDQMPEAIRGLEGAPWTMGYGDTLDVNEGDKITRDEAERRLVLRMERDFLAPMRRAIKIEPTPNQLAALANLVWNIGVPAFLKSTVLKCHNRSDFAAAARAFGLFNKSRGKEDPVLVARRAEEAALYLEPDDEQPAYMPQAVDAEKPMSRSTIATAGTATAAVSTVSVVAQVSQEVRTIKDSIGDILPWVILAAAVVGIGLGAFAVYERIKQRRGGWA